MHEFVVALCEFNTAWIFIDSSSPQVVESCCMFVRPRSSLNRRTKRQWVVQDKFGHLSARSVFIQHISVPPNDLHGGLVCLN